MLQVIIQHLQEIHYFWLIANQCQHNNAKCILQLCMLIKLIQNHIRIHITTQFDADPHTFTARLVAQICDSIDFLISYKLCNLLNQSCFIYHKWKFRYNNPVFSILHRLNIGNCTHTNLSTTCSVCFFNTSCTKDFCTRREVRSFNDLQNFFDRCLFFIFDLIVNDLYYCCDHFSQIVWRNIGSHSYGNS